MKTLQNQVVELRRYVSELEEKAGTQSTVATGPLTVDGHHDRVVSVRSCSNNFRGGRFAYSLT